MIYNSYNDSYEYSPGGGYGMQDEDALRDEELEEAERMIRNGSTMRHIARKQFTYLGQSDIFKLFRKYGVDPNDPGDDIW